MAQADDNSELTARILYWGVAGSGKTTSLQTIHAKLKPNRRGELERTPTRLDPTVSYEELAIELGSLHGVRTQLRIVAVPGSGEQAHTRKQLLDRVDGVVLVLDAQRDRLDDNLASLIELRQGLEAYGRTLSAVPVVAQYNKRDLSDPFAVEDMHRRLALPNAAVFETIATEGTGILQCLTTISKQVVRAIRNRHLEPEPIAPVVSRPVPDSPSLTAPISDLPPQVPEEARPIELPTPLDPCELTTTDLMETAILAEGECDNAEAETVLEAQAMLDRPWSTVEAEIKATPGARIGADLKIVSVGAADRSGERAVRLPLVLGNDQGETVTLALTIQLDPLLDDEPT